MNHSFSGCELALLRGANVRPDPKMAWASALLLVMGVLTGCIGSGGAATAPPPSPPTQVTVVRPERVDLIRRISLAGSAMAWEQVMVYSKVAGYLKSLHVDRGDFIRSGESIAEIEVPEMEGEMSQQGAAVEEAQSALEIARAQEARLKKVRDARPDAVTPDEIESAESRTKAAAARLASARAGLDRLLSMASYLRIAAPCSGVIGKRFLDVGALVPAGTTSQSSATPIVSLYSIDRLRVVVDVPETDAAQTARGRDAKLVFDAIPGRTFQGHIGRYSGVLDAETRTLRTEIDVENPKHEILPGMFCRALIDLETHKGALSVPAGTLVVEKQKRSVFTVQEGKAKKVSVKTGADDGIRVEILDGLRGEDQVVLAGKDSLSDGAPVAIASEHR